MSHKKQDFNKEQDFFYDAFEELASGWCPSKPLNEELKEIEKERVESALAEHNNNRTKAAAQLCIGRTLLIHKIKKYDLV